MPDFSKSKIYRIICHTTGDKYIGSTTRTLSRRLTHHLCDYGRWLKGAGKYVSSFQILERGNYTVELVENCPCQTVKELRARERYHVETTLCVNRRVPGRTRAESSAVWTLNNRSYKLQYYKEHGSTKITCSCCGCVVSRRNISTHKKSSKCITKALEQITTTPNEQNVV